MRKLSCVLLLALNISSCTGYRSHFDCPPSCGVPCTPVSDLEAMIVETEKGPDVFLPEERQKAPYLQGKVKLIQRSIWIPKNQSQKEKERDSEGKNENT